MTVALNDWSLAGSRGSRNRVRKAMDRASTIVRRPVSRSERQRWAGLDVLRFWAIVLVLGRHIGRPQTDLPWLVATWQQGGWVGVDLFFVLSGFLVSGLLFGEYKTSGRILGERFYIRRWWKIYPPFVVLIAATAVFDWQRGELRQGGVVTELLLVQNYVGGLWNHTWSLAVEEHFYLVLPPILMVTLRAHATRPFAAIPWLALVIGAGCLALRLYTWIAADVYTHLRHVFPTHLRIDGLFLGVALAHIYHFRRETIAPFVQRWRHVLGAAGACAFLPAFVLTLETSLFINTVGFTLFSVGAAMLVAAVVESGGSDSLFVRVQAFFGARSYSIYLWHMPVALWLMPMFASSPLVVFLPLYVAAALLLGTLMAALVEAPALRVRDRLFGRLAAATPGESDLHEIQRRRVSRTTLADDPYNHRT